MKRTHRTYTALEGKRILDSHHAFHYRNRSYYAYESLCLFLEDLENGKT